MRRHLLIAAIFLLSGAIVNVAVAWGFCRLLEFGKMHLSGEPPDKAELDWLVRLGWQPLPTHRVTMGGGRRPGVAWNWFLECGPGGSIPGANSMWVFAYVMRGGWPLDALHGGIVDGRAFTRCAVPVNGMRFQSNGLPIMPTHVRDAAAFCPAWTDFTTPRQVGIVPLQPVWPGFAVNTLFYAAVLWLLISGPFVLRRFIRVRRVLCPACAYPMSESAVCSECGKALPGRAKVAT